MSLILISCSSSGSRTGKEHRVHLIVRENIQARRPMAAGADPKATSPVLDENFQRADLTSKLDCQPLLQIFDGIDFAQLHSCLNDIGKMQSQVEVSYQLKREIQPVLQMDPSKQNPSCLQEVLPQIPVPRELVFQSNESGKMTCYSARIPLATEEPLGIQSFLFRTRLKMSLPLAQVPDTPRAMRALLMTWAVSPFFDPDDHVISATDVPQAICEQCMKGSHLFKDTELTPELWSPY